MKRNQGPDVYRHFMARMNEQKGKVFFLKEYDQLFLIDILSDDVNNYEYGHIECQFRVGWKIIESEGKFRFR